MTTDAQSGQISMTEAAVTAFPTLFKPKQFSRNGKPTGEKKYSASFIFDPKSKDFLALRDKVLQIAKAKWPGRNIVEEYKQGLFKLPFTSGDKLADARKKKVTDAGKTYTGDGEYQRGKQVLKTSTKIQPSLSVYEGGQAVDVTETNKGLHQRKFYSGVLSVAQFNFVAYDGVDGSKDGVTAYLNSVMSLNKGDRLSGPPPASEVFKDYVGSASDENVTEGLEVDDAIGF